MSKPSIPDRNVVILVDNKIRDLDGAELIAHHLRGLGIQCHLEPLGGVSCRAGDLPAGNDHFQSCYGKPYRLVHAAPA